MRLLFFSPLGSSVRLDYLCHRPQCVFLGSRCALCLRRGRFRMSPRASLAGISRSCRGFPGERNSHKAGGTKHTSRRPQFADRRSGWIACRGRVRWTATGKSAQRSTAPGPAANLEEQEKQRRKLQLSVGRRVPRERLIENVFCPFALAKGATSSRRYSLTYVKMFSYLYVLMIAF